MQEIIDYLKSEGINEFHSEKPFAYGVPRATLSFKIGEIELTVYIGPGATIETVKKEVRQQTEYYLRQHYEFHVSMVKSFKSALERMP